MYFFKTVHEKIEDHTKQLDVVVSDNQIQSYLIFFVINKIQVQNKHFKMLYDALRLELRQLNNVSSLVKYLTDSVERIKTPINQSIFLFFFSKVYRLSGQIIKSILYLKQAKYYSCQTCNQQLSLKIYRDLGYCFT